MIEITDQTLPDIFGDIEKIIEKITQITDRQQLLLKEYKRDTISKYFAPVAWVNELENQLNPEIWPFSVRSPEIIERIERTIASYFTRNNVSFLSDSNSDNVVIKVGSFKEDKITKLTMSSKDPVYKCKRDVLVSFEAIDLLDLEPTIALTEQSFDYSEIMSICNEIFKTMAFAAPELSN